MVSNHLKTLISSMQRLDFTLTAYCTMGRLVLRKTFQNTQCSTVLLFILSRNVMLVINVQTT